MMCHVLILTLYKKVEKKKIYTFMRNFNIFDLISRMLYYTYEIYGNGVRISNIYVYIFFLLTLYSYNLSRQLNTYKYLQ